MDLEEAQDLTFQPSPSAGPLQQGEVITGLIQPVPSVSSENGEELRRHLPPGSHFWKRVKQNKDERYALLRSVPDRLDAQGSGLPSLGLDFKRYFTLPTDVVYEQVTRTARRRSALTATYAAHLSVRFFAFQCRLALPVDHHWSPQPTEGQM